MLTPGRVDSFMSKNGEVMDSTSDVVLSLAPALIEHTTAEQLQSLLKAVDFTSREAAPALAVADDLAWWRSLIVNTMHRRGYATQD